MGIFDTIKKKATKAGVTGGATPSPVGRGSRNCMSTAWG
jgi:hypothetical protein